MPTVEQSVSRVELLAEQVQALPYAKPHCQAGDKWHNWSIIGGECRPEAHVYPRSVSEVADVIRAAAAASPPRIVRAAGSGMSPNTATFTPHVLLHTDHLRHIVSLDEKAKSVTCEAGITLMELSSDLAARGLSLPVIPSVLGPTLGGAIANAAHATGLGVKSLSGYVRGVKVVDGRGDLHTIDATTPLPPSVAKVVPRDLPVGTTLLDAFACNLGVLGVVVEITVALEPLSTVHLVQQPIPLDRAKALISQRTTMNEFYRISWVPHTDMCYEVIGKRLAAADDEAATSVAGTAKSGTSRRPEGAKEKDAKEASRVRKAIHLISSPTTLQADQQRWYEEQHSAAFKAAKAVKGPWLKRDVTERALAVSSKVPQLQASVNRTFQRTFLNDKEDLYGPLHEVMPIDCLFKQHGMEFAIDAPKWRELLDETQRIIQSRGLHVHFPVEVRFCDGESSWLAPNYGRKTCYMGVVMYKPLGADPPDWKSYFDAFEQAATRMGGRPHWAKRFTWTRADFDRAYPLMPAFRELQSLMDPKGIFRNEWYRAFA